MNIDQILESKDVYRTTFPTGHSFLWRLLTLKEYRLFAALRTDGPSCPVPYKVFDRCYAGNVDFLDGDIPAGYIWTVGNLILWLSGACSSETLRDDLYVARETYNDGGVYEYMVRTILTAFPSYVLEDVDDWTRPELFKKFTISEVLLAERAHHARGVVVLEEGGYKPLDPSKILMPGEEPRKKPGLDFKNLREENRELQKHLGAGEDAPHPTEMSTEQLAAMRQQYGFGNMDQRRKIAQTMDRRRR